MFRAAASFNTVSINLYRQFNGLQNNLQDLAIADDYFHSFEDLHFNIKACLHEHNHRYINIEKVDTLNFIEQ